MFCLTSRRHAGSSLVTWEIGALVVAHLRFLRSLIFVIFGSSFYRKIWFNRNLQRVRAVRRRWHVVTLGIHARTVSHSLDTWEIGWSGRVHSRLSESRWITRVPLQACTQRVTGNWLLVITVLSNFVTATYIVIHLHFSCNLLPAIKFFPRIEVGERRKTFLFLAKNESVRHSAMELEGLKNIFVLAGSSKNWKPWRLSGFFFLLFLTTRTCHAGGVPV